MKKLLILFFILSFFGCGNSKNINLDNLNSPYKANGIKLHYLSLKNLNKFENQSSSIVLWLYQLNDKNMFNQLCKTMNGKIELLKGKNFDKSVINISKNIIFPDTNGTIILDKLKNTKFLGIVAGFYESPKCLLIPFKTKTTYFNSLKFWQPKMTVENLEAKIKLFGNNVQIIKDKNE